MERNMKFRLGSAFIWFLVLTTPSTWEWYGAGLVMLALFSYVQIIVDGEIKVNDKSFFVGTVLALFGKVGLGVLVFGILIIWLTSFYEDQMTKAGRRN